MELKEYLSNTIELTQNELDNFDSLFGLKEVVNEGGDSLVFFYSKENPVADFNVFIKHKDSTEFKDTLEPASLGKLVEFIRQAPMAKVVEIMQILTINPVMLSKVKTTITAINDKAVLQERELENNEVDRKFEVLSKILNSRLDAMIQSANVELVGTGEILEKLAQEIKFLISTLPPSDLGYAVMVGPTYQETTKNFIFPTHQEVIEHSLRSGASDEFQIFGIGGIEFLKKYTILSIIPKSNPEKAMLLYKELDDYKSLAMMELKLEIHESKNDAPSAILNKTMNTIFNHYTKDFTQIADKADINNLFTLSELPLLEKFLADKQSRIFEEVQKMSEWMKINCEKCILNNTISNAVEGPRSLSDIKIKEALKV